MVDIVVDVEANGPYPGAFSMIQIGAVVCGNKNPIEETFFAELKPNQGKQINLEALKAIGLTHAETLKYPKAEIGVQAFNLWLTELKKKYNTRLIMWSDNPAFDWSFVNHYLYESVGENQLGYSARRIGDLYCGHVGSLRAPWKFLRETKHTHNALDDVKGNAEALFKIKEMLKERNSFQ